MKRFALRALALLMVLLLAACGRSAPARQPEAPSEPESQSLPQQQQAPAADPGRPDLTLQTACYWNDFVVEIPLVVGADTETTRQMNRDFAALAEEFAGWDVETSQSWLEWNSRLYPSSDYLQVVLTRMEYPNYGCDVQQVLTWCYDVRADRMVELEEALERVGLTAQSAQELFRQQAAEGQEQRLANLAELQLAGFRITGDGTADFYWLATSQPEGAEPWVSLYTMCCGDGWCALTHYRDDDSLRR